MKMTHLPGGGGGEGWELGRDLLGEETAVLLSHLWVARKEVTDLRGKLRLRLIRIHFISFFGFYPENKKKPGET